MAISNLYEYYQSKGQQLPALEERGKLYEGAGLGKAADYVAKNRAGDVGPNTALLAYLTKQEPSAATPPPVISSSAPVRSAEADEAAARVKKDQEQQTELDRLRREKELSDLRASLAPAAPAPAAPKLEEQYRTLVAEKDPLGLGLADYQNKLVENRKKRAEAEAELSRFRATAPAGQPQSSYLAQLGEKQRLAQDVYDRLDREANILNAQISNRTDVINTIMGLKKEDYANSSASYDKEFSRNIAIYNAFTAEENRASTIEDRAKDNARANLQIIQNAIQKGNLDYDSLDPATLSTIDNLEAQIGMRGISRYVTANVKGDIVSQGSRTDSSGNEYFDVLFRKPDNGFEISTFFRGKGKPPSGGEETETDFRKEVAAAVLRMDESNTSYEAEFRALKARFPYLSDAAIYAALGPKQ